MPPSLLFPRFKTAFALFFLTFGLFSLTGPGVVSEAAAQIRKPLIQEGKKTLFQRVLTRPEAVLAKQPGGAEASELTPFTVFFVYGRQDFGGETWLEVGPGSEGQVSGWIRENQVVAWKQTITVAFTNPAGRERVLMFKDRESLEGLINSDDLLVQAETFRTQAEEGDVPADSPIVAIEPANAVDLTKQFYLMPILEAEEVFLDTGFPVTLLKVASVSQQELVDQIVAAPSQDGPEDIRSAITFVVDATTSMGPFINRTRDLVKRVFKRIETAGLQDRVRFGLVAYRDNVGAAPGLDYVSRLFVDPNKVDNADDFLARVQALEPSTVSSQGFSEDAYAGIVTALRDIDWSNFDGRYVVLVSDAGPRDGKDPLGQTGLSAPEMNQLARRLNSFVYVMHLLTPQGQGDHEKASQRYENLAKFGAGGESLYYPVAAGDVDAFGQIVDSLADAIIKQVERSSDKEAQEKAVDEARQNLANAEGEDAKRQSELALKSELVGLAIQLKYLGQIEGTQAPSVFESWLTDRDFRDPNVASLDVRVLLSKNQLSDLQEALKQLIDVAERSQLSPGDFFDQLQSAAAALGRAPERISSAKTIAELGLIGEYLDGLPYRSDVQSIDQALWSSWGVGKQQELIDRLRSKIELYTQFHDDASNWVLLANGAAPGDAVYPIPLDALP